MSFMDRVTGFVRNWTADSKTDEGFGQPVEFNAAEEDNCVTSKMGPDVYRYSSDDWHMPVIDLDIQATLIPSSSIGHSHLYIDVPMSFENYIKLLTVMVEVGIVQEGYLKAAQKRGYGTLRLPWVLKEGVELDEQVKRLLG